MLKIRDNVDLKELEKFGFEFEKTLCMFDRHIKQENKFIKIISQNIEELIFIEVDISNRKIISKRYVKNWNRLDKCEMNEHYIKDLIKADLVEECEEC